MRARTFAWTLLLFASVAGASTLDEAFRREQAMLEAERTSLRATLADERERVRGREAALRRLLATATDSVNAMEMDIAALRRELNAAVRSPGSVGVDAAVANATLALRDLGITLPAGPDSTVSARVAGLVGRSLEVLRTASSLHVTDGTFFDAAGREQEGAIVHVGRVARLGSAPDAGGVLAPAGAGRGGSSTPAPRRWPAPFGRARRCRRCPCF